MVTVGCGGVVGAVYTAVAAHATAAGCGAAVADPDDVPVVAVGGGGAGESAGQFLGSVKRPVDDGSGPVANARHDILYSHVPVCVTFHYDG